MELAFLYRENYLRMVGLDLGFPVTDDLELINNVLADDSNEKYIHEIDFAPLDSDVYQACNDS